LIFSEVFSHNTNLRRTICHSYEIAAMMNFVYFFSTLAPDVICNACSYYDSNSHQFRRPSWREHPPRSANGGGPCEYYPSANHTPTMFCPVMIKGQGRVIQPMMWGLIPPWHKVSLNLKFIKILFYILFILKFYLLN